jgi:alpha-tubulin suppressor-like RCC1 family protein
MRHKQSGFALPTILIASVVMLVVLVSAVSATSSVRSALDGQYYNRLAREAAESGVARASQCLQDSAFIVQWSNTNNLRPNTTCSGGASCTNADSCFVMNSGSVRTTFSVGQPTSSTSSQLVAAVGKVELLRTSSGSVARTYTYTASGRVGIDLNPNTVAFGYDGLNGGAYFATISADGKMRAAGFNSFGELGNGTTANTLVPTDFKLSGTDRAVAIFTGFLSQGYSMFAITDKGTVYGAGKNDTGQLGDGTTTNRSTPVQFGLPAGVKATHVTVGGRLTYVTGTDNKVYASGECSFGGLGTNYTISGCADRLTYKAVAMPTPNVADTNTLPTNNILFDGYTGFARMQGGRLYGWGRNQHGQMGDGTFTDGSIPEKIGTYGDSGQPQAVSAAFDGDSIYVADNTGAVKTSGRNDYGELAGAGIPIYNANANVCLDNKNQDGLTLQFHACNGTVAQQFTFRSDGSIYYPNKDKCVDNLVGDGLHMQLWTCNNLPPQKFIMRDDGTIYNPNTNTCLDNNGGDGVSIQLWGCDGLPFQNFTLKDISGLVNFTLPSGAGNAVKVDTDQWSVSVLTDHGEVWSAGRNDQGQLGDGTVSLIKPYPVKFILPAGITATDIASSAYYKTATNTAISNLFVIGSDGKVYGTGNNDYGQLGDGTTTQRSTPVAMNVIDGISLKAKDVESGFGTTVVLTYGKKLYTVGNNSNGQLGDGTTTNSLVPKANRYTNVLPLAIF